MFVPFWLTRYSQDTFPARDELLSDLSDDDMQLAKVPEILKPTVISFKHKDDTDLFGLGIQEEAPAAKDSSEEQEGKSLNILPKRHVLGHLQTQRMINDAMLTLTQPQMQKVSFWLAS